MYRIAILVLSISAFINATPIVKNDPMYNPGLFEGDIAGVKHNTKGLARLPTVIWQKWPGGVVPYVIDSNTYNSTQIQIIKDGIAWIEDQTRTKGIDCIRFVPRTNEATFLRIHSGSGCWSYVGKQAFSGEQLVSIALPTATSRGCVNAGVVAHELIHALGFYHEQSRPDRDDHVNIYWENISPETAYNFDKYTTGVDTLGFPYDVHSIMHYPNNAFSINGLPTIEAKEPGVVLIDAREKDRLTDIDVGELRKFYGCL